MLEEHENEKCPLCLPEVQFHSLTRKLEAENQQLKEEFVVVNQKLHEFESENQTMREESKQMKLEMTRITQAQDKTSAVNQHLKQDVQELTLKINKLALALEQNVSKEELSQIRLKQEKEVKALEKETKAKCALLEAGINPTPPFYFVVTNFAHYKKNGLRWDSPPFYSHPGGYKLKPQVWPNGFSTQKGTYVSVFIAVIRGEYDDQLKWPFTGEVTVRLLNLNKENALAQDSGHWDRTISFDNETPFSCCCKPVGCSGLTSWGYSDFIAHPDLSYNAYKNTVYLVHDIVRFVVTKVELK